MINSYKILFLIASIIGTVALVGCKEEKVLTVSDNSSQAKLNWAVINESPKSITLGSVVAQDNSQKTYKEKLEVKKVCISGVVYLITENYIYTSVGNETIYSLTPYVALNKENKSAQYETCQIE